MDVPSTGPWSMRLADAEVAQVHAADDGLHIRLAIVPVQAADVASRTPDALNASGVTLHLAHLRSHRLDAGCIGRVAEGRIAVDGLTVTPLSLPFDVQGAVSLELRFANGAMLDGEGLRLSIQTTAGTQVTEHLHC